MDSSDNGTPYESVPTTVRTGSSGQIVAEVVHVVRVTVMGRPVELTADQARQMAQMLNEAADMLDGRSR